MTAGSSAGSRVGSVFKGMATTCPQEIALYAKCVVAQSDQLDKGLCEKEFAALRTCFQKTRKGMRK